MTELELKKMLNRCSRCGTCQAYCPLYNETRREPFVARGKIELLELLNQGKIQWNDKSAEIFSTCLLCGNCSENCPNMVKADSLVREGRRDLVASRGLPIIKRTVFQYLLKKDGRLGVLAKMLCLYQHLGLQKLVRASKVLKVFPGDLAAKERILPPLSFREFRRQVPAVNKAADSRLKVAYFTGCMTNYVYPQTGYSLLKVLTANGVEVIIPEQVCCGIPALASGDYETTRELAVKNLTAFAQAGADYIITDCASCLGTWLEYPELLTQDPQGEQLAKKVMDISTFLVEVIELKLPRQVNLGIITYHDPCHLKRTKGGKTNPRSLLKSLGPQTTFVEMENADSCCGSAGSFNLSHYRLSQQVAAKKIKAINDTYANYLTTGCPACIMQLQHAVNNSGLSVQVAHPIELIAKVYE
ncbi:MAG: (Fe-S)-binding protein [Bacillota bacterium]